MRDNNKVPTDLRKFVEFGGMACPVSNQVRSNKMWIQVCKWEHLERWVESRAITSIVRNRETVTIVGPVETLSELNYADSDEARQKMADLLRVIALAPDSEFANAPVIALTPEQESKLKIADAAIAMMWDLPTAQWVERHRELNGLVKDHNAKFAKAGEAS